VLDGSGLSVSSSIKPWSSIRRIELYSVPKLNCTLRACPSRDILHDGVAVTVAIGQDD
jgi:hypothetical protein